jgi:hypothetical protein
MDKAKFLPSFKKNRYRSGHRIQRLHGCTPDHRATAHRLLARLLSAPSLRLPQAAAIFFFETGKYIPLNEVLSTIAGKHTNYTIRCSVHPTG